MTLVLFLERNGRRWAPEDVAKDAGMVEAIAAGSVERKAIAEWIRERSHLESP